MLPPRHDAVFVISDLGSGGAQRILTAMVNSWLRSGRRIAVVTLSDETLDFYALEPGAVRISLDMRSKSRHTLHGFATNVQRVHALRRVIRELDAPVVMGWVGSVNVLVILATLWLGCRTVLAERNDPRRQPLPGLWERLRRVTYRFADVVTANSSGALDHLALYVPRRKLRRLGNPVLVPETAVPVRTDNAGPLRILCVGRLHHQKAHDVLLEAVALLYRKGLECQVCIAGEGPDGQALRALAEGQGIAGRVEWVGVTRKVAALYRSTDVFVLASRYEGVPNALLEAMSHGLACIVSDASPGPLEYVRHRETGWVVPVESAERLAAAIQALHRDPQLRASLGMAARERIRGETIERLLPQWESVIWGDGGPGRS